MKYNVKVRVTFPTVTTGKVIQGWLLKNFLEDKGHVEREAMAFCAAINRADFSATLQSCENTDTIILLPHSVCQTAIFDIALVEFKE